jgi:hypothetical protein
MTFESRSRSRVCNFHTVPVTSGSAPAPLINASVLAGIRGGGVSAIDFSPASP